MKVLEDLDWAKRGYPKLDDVSTRRSPRAARSSDPSTQGFNYCATRLICRGLDDARTDSEVRSDGLVDLSVEHRIIFLTKVGTESNVSS